MSPQVSVGMIIWYASHNLRFIYSTNTKYFKECPKVSTGETRTKTCINPYAKITPMSPRESASWVPKHTSSESIEYPIVTTGMPRKTYIKCSQIHNSIQFNNSETSKVKLNLSQDRGGKTPYDSTIITKLVVHQDRSKSRTREREIKHIATGTYPQPRGWTTPSSSWRPPGWWRWPQWWFPPPARCQSRSRLVFCGFFMDQKASSGPE